MSDTPKFEVIDRRKIKAEEEKESAQSSPEQRDEAAPAAPKEPAPGPRLVVNEAPREEAKGGCQSRGGSQGPTDELPPAPTAEESQRAEEPRTTPRRNGLKT